MKLLLHVPLVMTYSPVHILNQFPGSDFIKQDAKVFGCDNKSNQKKSGKQYMVYLAIHRQ